MQERELIDQISPPLSNFVLLHTYNVRLNGQTANTSSPPQLKYRTVDYKMGKRIPFCWLKVKTSIGNAPISKNEMEALITNHVKEYVLTNKFCRETAY